MSDNLLSVEIDTGSALPHISRRWRVMLSMSKPIKKVVVIEKLPEYDYRLMKGKSLESPRRSEEKMLKMQRERKLHNDFTKSLRDILDKSGAEYEIFRDYETKGIDYSAYDLIMTNGGDGTFLTTAGKLNEEFVVGLNSTYTSDNEGSAGGLTIVDSRNLYQLERLFTGQYSIQRWRRLNAAINDEMIDDLAVNDILISASRPQKGSHLEVVIDDMSERFLGSGAILTTGMGSHAWFRSAGGTQFGNELNIFGLVMREPFIKREKYKFTSMIMSEGQKVVIYPDRDDHMVVFDGKDKEYSIGVEDYVTIGLSDRSINVVKFD